MLTRVVSIIKVSAVKGLPFQDNNQKLESLLNGLFLSCLELISIFNLFLAQHMAKYGNKSKGRFISSDIYNKNEETSEPENKRNWSWSLLFTPYQIYTSCIMYGPVGFVLQYIHSSMPAPHLIKLSDIYHKSEILEKSTLLT